MNKLVGLVGFVVLVAGCGGGSGSSGSGFNPGVQGSKPLDQLSAAEAQTVCQNAMAYVTAQLSTSALMEQECRATGIAFASLGASDTSTDADLQQACAAGYQLCESSPADGGASVDTGGDDCSTAMQQVAGCAATVDQYTACVNETISQLRSEFPACNQLTKAELAALNSDGGSTNASSGPACQAVETACPSFATSDTMSALTSMARGAR